MSIDLSIVVPSIRQFNWPNLIKDIEKSLYIYSALPYSYEIIFVGPYYPPQELQKLKHIKYIQSWASPATCLQIGGLFAKGNIFVWLPDDIKLEPEALARSINLLKNHTIKDTIILRYSEGPNFTGNQDNIEQYWQAITHDGLRFRQVRSHWKIAPVFMGYTKYFHKLGGIDCSLEHCNLNCIDYNFRSQLDGGQLLFSPTKVFSADWIDPSSNNKEYKSVYSAYTDNDLPKFINIWDSFPLTREICIHYDNWQNQSNIWQRRFK